MLCSAGSVHHFIDIGVEVCDEPINLRHHTVTLHAIVFLALLEEATETCHHVVATFNIASVESSLDTDINRHVIEDAKFLLGRPSLRFSELIAHQTRCTSQARVLINHRSLLRHSSSLTILPSSILLAFALAVGIVL